MTTKLTLERLHELLHYNPLTGYFTRKRSFYRGKAGSVVGYTCPRGYVQISVDAVSYRAHRLAFFFMTGQWPTLIDHINRNRSDNRWANLRETTHVHNSMNMGHVGRATTGVRNVSFNRKRNNYEVKLRCKGKNIFIGVFNELELADLVAQMAREKYFKEFA